jgi:hypothetical protein
VQPKANEFEREMQMLEAEIKRLEAEYNMFFAGRLPRLPWETRKRVEALVKRYDREPMTNTAQRFRFGTLQSKFQSFVDLWEKQLKAREEGRPLPGQAKRRSEAGIAAAGAAQPSPPPMVEGAFGVAAAAARAEAKAEAKKDKKDREALLHEARIKDPLKEVDRLKELHHQLSEARAKSGEAQIPFDRFAQVVRAQVSKLGGGDQEVSFRVAMKEGKVTLTVKGKGDSGD